MIVNSEIYAIIRRSSKGCEIKKDGNKRQKGLSKRLAMPVLLLLTVLLLTACGQEQTPQNLPSQTAAVTEPQPTDSDTLLIYMCGGTLEEKNGAGSSDIDELLQAVTAEDVNIVLQTGGATDWKRHGISAQSLQRYEISDNTLHRVWEGPLASMGKAWTLTEFVSWGMEEYPAQRTSLLLWGHGFGAQGVCEDTVFFGDVLTAEELTTALSDCRLQTPLSLIGFDACYMSEYSTVQAMTPFADAMIASPVQVPAGGWDYRVLAQSLGKDSFLTDILQGFADANAQEDYILTLIDLTAFDAVQQTHDAVVRTQAARLAAATEGSLVYKKTGNTYFYDLGQVAQALATEHTMHTCLQTTASAAYKGMTGISFDPYS